MSVGPLSGLLSSVAGTPLAQTKGSEIERAQQDLNAQQRQTVGQQRAESAAGIGETDGQDHEAAERDADGRRLWEEQLGKKQATPTEEGEPGNPPLSKDVTGQSGTQLDLCG
jgi:hypothetical protein